MTLTSDARRDRLDERGREPGQHRVIDPGVTQQDSEAAFDRTLDEGQQRLERSWVGLTATGLMGGLDIGTGVLALLLVQHLTHSHLLAGLAFAVGFIALSLGRSELFTEDFLVPVSTVIAKRGRWSSLLRLWAVTIVTNLVGGWVITWIIVQGFPSLRETGIEAGQYYAGLGIGLQSFCLALVGGLAITLMTWMQHNTESDGVRLVPAVTTGFLLAAAQLNHAIVNSLLMFTALHSGHAPFGYLDWLGTFAWAALGNMVGGIGLVTVLRLLQVTHKVTAERQSR